MVRHITVTVSGGRSVIYSRTPQVENGLVVSKKTARYKPLVR
jgi:hypothetical protein